MDEGTPETSFPVGIDFDNLDECVVDRIVFTDSGTEYVVTKAEPNDKGGRHLHGAPRWSVKPLTLAVAVVVLTVGLFGTPGAVSAAEPAEVPASVGTARIYVRDTAEQTPASGHTFSFYVYLNVCPTPFLEVVHTTLVERPAVGSSRGAAIVTLISGGQHTRNSEKVCHARRRCRSRNRFAFGQSVRPPT